MENIKYIRNNYNIDKLYKLDTDYQVIKLIKENSKILELGCATGYIGKYLKEKKNCEVTGIELNKEAANIAKNYYKKIIIGNIEDNKILSELEKYDYILCMAILEHIKDPYNIIKKLKEYLKENGEIIITLPNIAHWTIRLKLLFGRFEYTKYGILDETHIRFFTLKTAKKIIYKAGLKINYFSIDPDMGIPCFNGIIKRIPIIGINILKFIYSLFPGLFAYQFIFKVCKLKND